MSNNDKRKGRSLDSTIVAALIGGFVTIVVALITVFGNRLLSNPSSQPTATSPAPVANTATWTAVPTDTVPPGRPTSTPAPATETPTATITSIAPVPVGQDWMAGCISTFWKLYPADLKASPRDDGCWQEPLYVFSAENGDLDFLAQDADGSTIFGLFAPLPSENGTVSFKVRLRDLNNVDLLMGVYAEPDVVSQGLLMTIPQGNVKKRVIVQKDNINSYTTLQSTGNLDQGDGYWFTFSYSLNSVRSTLNPNVFVTNPVSVPSAQKWLFLGYKVLNRSYRIDGTFFSLEVK